MERLRRHHHRQRRRRRHARPPARPVGQAHPAARARRLAAARAAELGRRRTCSSTTATSRATPGTTSTASRSSRRSTTSSAARPSSTARRSTACARRTSASCSHHDGISPAWPISYDEMEPYYTQAEQLYQVHGARGEDPTEPPASAPYPFPALSPRAAHPAARPTTSPRPATTRSTRPAACMLDEAEHAVQHAASAARPATASRAWCTRKSDAEVLGVRPALEHPNVTLLTDAEAAAAGDQRGRHAPSPSVVVERDGARETVRAATSSSSRCGAANTAKLLLRVGQRRATPTGSPTAPTRSGATTCSTTARPCSRCRKEPNPTVFQKTLGLNDFYFGTDDFEFPMGNIQMVGKSPARDVPRREAARDQARAAVDARARSPPRRRLLAVDRGPAAPRQPRHARPRRARSRSPTRRPTRSRRSGSTTSSSRCSGTSACTPTTCIPRHAYLKNDIPVAGCRAPGRHLPLRRRPGDLGARHRLPGARGRQPLRRRHELLPEHRRREPGADGDGQRAAGRRPPRSSGSARTSARGARACRVSAPRAAPRDRRGGGFAGLGCARRLAERGRRPRHAARPQQLPPVPAAALPGGDRPSCAPSDIAYSLRKLFRERRERRRQAGEVTRRSTPRRARVTTADGRALSRATRSCSRRARSRTSSAPRAPRSTRSRSTRSTTRSGCARGSSACSRTPTATRADRSRAR